MAEGVMFHYRGKATFLHTVDPRVKLLYLLLQSFSLVFLTPSALVIPGVFSVLLALFIRLPLKQYGKEGMVFLLLGMIIFLGRYLTGGTADALPAVSRFFIIVLLGLILMDTTSVDETSSALYWAVSWISPKKAGRLSAHMLLTLSFIPLMFDSVREVREARKARADCPGKHPLRFLVTFLIQVFDILLIKAEEISLALEAREFDGTVHPKPLSFSGRDLLALCICLFVIGAGFLAG